MNPTAPLLRALLPRRISQQFGLAAAILALVMSLTAGAASYVIVRGQIAENVEIRLRNMAREAAEKTGLVLDHVVRDIESLSGNPLLGNALADSRGREGYIVPFLKDYQARRGDGLGLALLDFRGKPYFMGIAADIPAAAGTPWFASAMAGIPAVHREGLKIIIAQPVIYPATGLAEGVLVGSFSLNTAVPVPPPKEAAEGMAYSLVFGRNDAGSGLDQDARDRLLITEKIAAPNPLGALELAIQARMERDVAERPLAALTRSYLLIGAVTSAAIFVIAFALGNRLTRPLTRLGEAARAIADGRDQTVLPDVGGAEEIHHLRDALSAMLERQQDHQRSLERRVTARTAELHDRERELQAHASRLHAILDNVVDGIITIDDQGIVVSVNPATERIFGWTAEEMTGQNVIMLIPHLGRDDVFKAQAPSRPDGVIEAGRRLNGRRKNGGIFPLELAVSEIPSDQTPLLIGVIRDITERVTAQDSMVQAKEAAETANRIKSDFLATMSHEIRTPLNGILGTIGLMLDGKLAPDQQRYAKVAERSGRVLLALINDILDFSKMEANRLNLEIADFRLRETVSEAIDMVSGQAREKKLPLTLSIAQDVPEWVRGDRVRVGQIILNLLSNAVKFTERGAVAISLRRHGTVVRCEISDSGIGIAPEDVSRLFARFSQIGNAPGRRRGGTGLGLAISKHLVELMGGQIGVDSEVGVGATFWFELPLPEGRPVDKIWPRHAAAGPLTGTLLLTEDSETNQFIARAILEKAGLTVDVAWNGREAVEAVQKRAYDAVLMDVAMPEMDGLEATRAIRALPGPESRVPIIAMTAFAMAGDAEQCLAAGMNDYITKPIQAEILLGHIACWLAQSVPSPAASPLASEPVQAVAGSSVLDEAVIAGLIADTDEVIAAQIAGKVAGELVLRAGRILAAAQAGDAEAAGREAHTVKSLAATIGALALRDRAEKAERLCRDDAAQGLAAMADLAAACREAESVVRQRFGLPQPAETNP